MPALRACDGAHVKPHLNLPVALLRFFWRRGQVDRVISDSLLYFVVVVVCGSDCTLERCEDGIDREQEFFWFSRFRFRGGGGFVGTRGRVLGIGEARFMVVERRDDRVFPSSQNPDLAHPNPSKRNMPRAADWVGSDPEMKRKKRVAKYKMLSVEAKVKDTVRSSCRWIKTKFMEVRYGWYA